MKRGWKANCLVAPSSALAVLAFAATASSDSMDDLVPAAKAEGQVTVMGLPRDWCGYGDIIDGFKAKYGLTVNELQPDASSADQIEAIKAGQGKIGPLTPDAIDVGMSFAASAKRDGLLQPFGVSTWDTIPDAAKDADGYWYGDYYGVIAFEINADLVSKTPRDWADLAAPEFRNSVSLAGDLSSNQAIQSVFAAGLSAANGNVEQAADQGLRFFADLNRKGNFLSIIGDVSSLVDGSTPILVRWDYLALGDRDRLTGKTRIEVVRPKTGVVAGVYVQAISALAPHPNAARLWMEYLYSDESQLAWLKGHCYPIRFADLLRNGKVPIDLREGLPPDDAYEVEPVFPTVEEQEKARKTITNGWDDIVGVDVKEQCLPSEDLGPMSFNDSMTCQPSIPQ